MITAPAHTRATFDIDSLESRELTELFLETRSLVPGITIEIVRERRRPQGGEAHPAVLIGLEVQKPIIRFVDSSDRKQRIEGIAHELVHLLLVYRFGLGLTIRRRPRPGNREDVFKYFMSMKKDWYYLLGQIGNTTHHLFLIDYLKEKHGIESDVHLHLLRHNFYLLANEHSEDIESLYAKGIIAFEYNRLIGESHKVMNSFHQAELAWKAYHSANEHFGNYCLPNIPTPSSHEENVLSFLEHLGYEREDFTFFP
jgi:hypothetical protein